MSNIYLNSNIQFRKLPPGKNSSLGPLIWNMIPENLKKIVTLHHKSKTQA